MGINEIKEILKKHSKDKEIILKIVSSVNTIEEFVNKVKENNLSLTDDECKKIFELFKSKTVLADSELNNVAGGGGEYWGFC